MEFQLRCNSLNCRTALSDRAVVTTCSHIFCLACSESLGLSGANDLSRACPACETQLPNPDDAVATQLNPSEDYKTSVLSGLSPGVIMECASRGLNFYSYQASQEIVYQEFLARSLREKSGELSSQMDSLVIEANHEIESLRNKIKAMQVGQQELQKKNAELAQNFKAKCKSHGELRKMYQALKQAQLTSGIELAAEHDAENALNGKQFPLPGTSVGRTSRMQQTLPLHVRAGSNGSGGGGFPGSRNGVPGATRLGNTSFSHTPSHHRTYLNDTPRGPPHTAGNQATPRRMPMQALDPNVYGNPNAAGYVGLPSATKAARQHGMPMYRGAVFGKDRSAYSVLNAR